MRRWCPAGENHHRARYADDIVEQALSLVDRGVSQHAVSRLLCVPRRTLRDWISGQKRVGLPDHFAFVELKPRAQLRRAIDIPVDAMPLASARVPLARATRHEPLADAPSPVHPDALSRVMQAWRVGAHWRNSGLNE